MSLNSQEAIQLIGKDNLHWSEDENRYILLSFDETWEIINRCVDSGITETEDIVLVIRKYEQTISNTILFRKFINGELNARIEDEEVFWAVNEGE
jgi:hypothetical protein